MTDVQGSKEDVANPWDGSSGSASQMAVLAALWGKLNTLAGAITSGTMKLAAGSNIIGKVGIDQTTPGTTNAVQVTGTVPLPTGAALDATLTGGTQQTRLTDGTTVANVLPIATGQNAVVVGSGYKEVTGLAGTGTGDLLPSTDVSAYRYVSIQITAIASATVTFQGSNDNSTWVTLMATPVGTGAATTAAAIAGAWVIPVTTRYIRAHHTVSGTSAGVAEFFTMTPSLAASILSAAQQGTWTLGTTATSNSLTTYHLVAAGSDNAANIKNAAAQVYDVDIYNAATYAVYVKLYNKATTPAPASDTPLRTIGVPPAGRASIQSVVGLPFGTGLGIAVVKGIGDTDDTAVVAGDCVVAIGYR